jgi:8-oxo-dGTP diphosphatase
MDTERMPAELIPCVGAIIRDDSGRLLLIKRGHEPGLGLWSLPGGRIEAGESDAEALMRELREETGLIVRPGKLIGSARQLAADDGEQGDHEQGDRNQGDRELDIRDYAATVIGGSLAAGDDAAEAAWVSVAGLYDLPLTEGLLEALTTWGVVS